MGEGQVTAGVRGGPSSGLPPLFRTLAALVVLDALVGLWLALHTRDGLALFLTPQLPALGVGGLMWGFLPEEPKKRFGVWLDGQLSRRALLWGIIGLGTAAVVASLFFSTVVLHSIDPSATVVVQAVRGTRERPDTIQLREAAAIRLNRLTSPQYHHVMTPPFGRQLWFYTGTHVSTRDWTLRPWLPLVLQYPDDFEPMVTVAVLPDESVLPRLSRRDAVLRVSDPVTEELLAAATLDRHSFLIAFGDPLGMDDDVRARWRRWLEALSQDTGFVNPMMARWAAATPIPAARPLRVGETLLWEVVDGAAKVLHRDTLALKHAVQDLHLVF